MAVDPSLISGCLLYQERPLLSILPPSYFDPSSLHTHTHTQAHLQLYDVFIFTFMKLALYHAVQV